MSNANIDSDTVILTTFMVSWPGGS